ncbi:tumor mating-type alpha-pheromone receptor [Ophiocordyceps sinensis CO18]|uniref:Tumor mating-type alpha-pheromone receptor n=1 Tax=Ophiocordyceps sinensis (strain Co18 / CGMCC 3.14243) TaxID=911162 RepID=T5A148_OPHSC|nr:tumor mating-type alpha-pheromone receptor [Ophiocordyceps sinensis CO18]
MDSISPTPPSSVLGSHPPPAPPGTAFDPFDQLVTFYGPDGSTVLGVPMAAVDAFNHENVATSLNYGAQLGAALVVAFAVLALTPAAKLRRPSSLLHLAGLAMCLARVGSLAVPALSPAGYFYVLWAGDYSTVPQTYFNGLVVGNLVGFLFVVVVGAALVHQAWAMVTLWPDAARYGLAASSLVITLTAVGFRFALTVMSCKAALDLSYPNEFFWLMQATLVTNAASIFWFCALFNSKLLLHLIANRGMLPSTRTLSAMEVLVMTNGVLMIAPVVFAGLEWGKFQNFESASLTHSSVVIILPLGTLAAQRMTARPSTAGNVAHSPPGGTPGPRRQANDNTSMASYSWPPSTPARAGAVEHHFDLELRQLDSTSDLAGGRNEHCLVQHDEAV